ncbi:MAG: ABC transporter permease [Rhodospirillaceae bacterium]
MRGGLISVGGALAASALVCLAAGADPVMALRLLALGAFGSGEALGYTLYYATSFIFAGLAVAVAFQAGLFNIGGEGQAMLGGLGAGLAALALDGLPAPLPALAGVALAALSGAGWALVPAWLQARRGSHIVITTIMFNFIASALLTWLLAEILIAPGQPAPESRSFATSAWLPALAGGPLSLAFPLALLAAAAVALLLWRTRWGHALRVAGLNPDAARYAGLSPARITIQAMLLSGALAGMVGVNEILGVQHRLLLGFTGGAGFVGIAVALMGRNHPGGVVLAALLFGALAQGGAELAFELPALGRDLVVVIQGLVVLAAATMARR